MTAPDYDDPFAEPERAPSLSFRDKPIGTSYTGKVTEAPHLVQARDFDSGDPAWWDDAKTQPKMAVVLNMEVDGETRSVWAVKPSAMFRAFGDAQKAANARIEVGGTVTVTFTGEKPNEDNPKKAPQKLYEVKYSPPDAFATGETSAAGGAAAADEEPPF